MNSLFEFFIGLGVLVLFGWYFATDLGARKRLLAARARHVAGYFQSLEHLAARKKRSGSVSISRAAPPFSFGWSGREGSHQGNARPGGRSHPQTGGLLRQRRTGHQPGRNRSDSGSNSGARYRENSGSADQLSRVAKLEFRLVYPDNGERLRAIDAGHGGDSAGISNRELQDSTRRRSKTDPGTPAGEEKGRSGRRSRDRIRTPTTATKAGPFR